jgi:DNA-binding CsgD family transcriptional regulator
MSTDLACLESELAYQGPERRGSESAGLVRLMACVLDEVDYGLVLLCADGLLVHANHAARRELGPAHPLELSGRRLRARHSHEQQVLSDALEGARHRGARSLVNLGGGVDRTGLSIVPLPLALSRRHSGNATLVTLQRTQLVEKLSAGAYARERGLSRREEQVLTALCEGLRPSQIAERLGVAVATVRSHVHNLKEKTHCHSMVELVKQVALLPPLDTALRTDPTAQR